MATFAIYLLTGLITLLPVLWLMLGAWMGVPVIATEYVSGIGSCILIVAAYLSLFERRTAAVFAMTGLLCTIPFWLVEPCKVFFHLSFPPIVVGLFAAFLLLGYSTSVYSIRDFRRRVVGPGADRGPSRAVIVVSVVCLSLLCGASYRQEKANERTPSRYVLPDGYVGWAVIHFQQPGAPSVPLREGNLEFDFPQAGVMRTSSRQQFGSARDHYFYKLPSGELEELRETGWGDGGMIWAESSGTTEVPGGPNDPTEQFFIGTESQYKQMQDLPSLHGGIVPGDMRNELH